jgi:hypothetical protein
MPRPMPRHRRPPREYYDDYYDDGYYPSYNRGRYRGTSGRSPPPPPPATIRPQQYRQSRRSTPRYNDETDYDYDRYDNYDDKDYNRGQPKKIAQKGYDDHKQSGGISGSVVAVIFVVFLLLLGFLFWPIIQESLGNGSPTTRYHEYPEGLDFTVRKSMTLDVSPTRQNSYISYKLKSACPKDKSFKVDGEDFYLQDIKDVNAQPEPSNGVPDITNQVQWVMLWEDSHFTGTKTFVIEYTIRTRFFQWKFDSENTGSISDISANLKQKYNHDEWKIDLDHDGVLDNDFGNDDDIDDDGQWDYMIEPTNQDIKKLANQIAGGETNAYSAVKKIYDYLTSDENLNYVTVSSGLPKACTITMDDLRGDCDDYSILFVSLCRALNIPAWLELGVLYDRQTKAWGGHAWAKVAIPLEGGGYSAPAVDIVNKQFMIYDPYRFIEWVDTGGDDFFPGEDTIRNNLDYYYHTFSFIATGRPDVSSPDTNNFMTINLDEFGETQRVAADGGSGLDTCMVPGFEISIAIPIVVFFVLLKNIDHTKKRRTR